MDFVIILRSVTGVTCGAGIEYPSGAPEFTTRLKESVLLIFCMDFDNYLIVEHGEHMWNRNWLPFRRTWVQKVLMGSVLFISVFSVFVQVDYLIAYDVNVSFLYFLALCINLVFLY